MITGSLVALVTPMHNNGDVDWSALKSLVEWHVAQGTHGIVAVGTTGESATLDVEEHCAVIKCVVETVNKRIPVIAGTGANSTREAIELTRSAKQAGADACLLVTPYYNKPTQEGLYQHYKAVAEAVDIPQILYNVPGRTGVDMSNATVARLAGLPNIMGIKDATGNLERGQELLGLVGDKMAVYSGDDATAYQLILMGAIFTLIAFFSDSTWGIVAGIIRNWLATETKRLVRMRITGGVVMVLLGLFTLWTAARNH